MYACARGIFPLRAEKPFICLEFSRKTYTIVQRGSHMFGKLFVKGCMGCPVCRYTRHARKATRFYRFVRAIQKLCPGCRAANKAVGRDVQKSAAVEG